MEAPVFVKIDDYKEVLDVLDLARDKLKQARDTLDRIDAIKQKEDAEFVEWRTAVDEIERKLDGVDSTLLQPET